MSLQDLAAWLRCPDCFNDLEAVSEGPPGVLGCETGHRFDVNRRGYVTMLPPRSRVVGDTAAMLDARAALLDSGAYTPILDALVDAVRPAQPRRVLDSGTGTGWYLHGLLSALSTAPGATTHTPSVRGLASDLSATAVARAVRGRPDIDGVVADVHAPLPLRDAVVDAITVVFAPRNPAEFARVLQPHGILAIVVPRPDHLAELRAATRMLDVPAGKPELLKATLAERFSPGVARHVTYRLTLGPERAAQLRDMGPSAHHRHGSRNGSGSASPVLPELPDAVTVSVDVIAYTRS